MNLNYINYIFTGFIIVMCLVLSFFMMFTTMFNERMDEKNRLIFVIVMISYAAFRTYRLMKSIREQKSKNEDE